MNKDIIKAFEGKQSLECLFQDNDSEAWFPEPKRAAKNFKNGYRKITREQALKTAKPETKPETKPVKRGPKPKIAANASSDKSEKSTENLS